MSEYIVQRDSLVNVADEIRVLSGTTAEMGLDVMKTCVSEANDVIDAQATTISEIAALLEGKSVPDGGVEMCTVTIADVSTRGYVTDIFYVTKYGYDSVYFNPYGSTSFETKRGSIIVLALENNPIGSGWFQADVNVQILAQWYDGECQIVAMYIPDSCTIQLVK